ncbi:MAG: caspase family protein [Polyangiaceae bacterium]|nr:caspase family protein [Polyangiaceae bacterium]
MAQARSLHIGLNAVDPAHYGSPLPLSGCHNDARDMAALARGAGYDATVLLDREATASCVLEALETAARSLKARDTFLLTYAGHGAQVPDESGDEADSLDETWVLFDRMLLDDEIYEKLARFERGVRIFVLSDSCHSGTVARKALYEQLVRTGPLAREYESTTLRFRTPEEPDFGKRVWAQHAVYQARARSITGNPKDAVRAAVIQLSGCQDDQLSADGDGNGLFTSKVKSVWASGAFQGNHRAFGQAVRAVMPPTQSPNYLLFGEDVTEFERERPFTVLREEAAANGCSTKGYEGMNTQTTNEGNWAEVRAALQKRLPGWSPPPASSSNGHGNVTPDTDSYVGQNVIRWADGGASDVSRSTRAATGAPIVRAFWWGFHIECSSQGLRDFLGAAEPINAIAGAIGPVTGPAAPFVMAAAAFIAAALQGLRNLDRGNGVYISMSWFAPGVFIPTTVPGGRGAGIAGTRGVGEPYEQAGDPWKRSYGGGLFGLRLEDDIYWNLPNGTVREHVIVHTNPPQFGNIYFNHWLSDDPTVGHFRLHVGVAAWQGGVVEIRMMIRDADGNRSVVNVTPGPRALTAAEL